MQYIVVTWGMRPNRVYAVIDNDDDQETALRLLQAARDRGYTDARIIDAKAKTDEAFFARQSFVRLPQAQGRSDAYTAFFNRPPRRVHDMRPPPETALEEQTGAVFLTLCS